MVFLFSLNLQKKSKSKQIFNHEKQIMEKIDYVICVMKNFHMIKV